MNIANYKNNGWVQYLPIAYFIKFIVSMVVLYHFHFLFYGLTTPGGKVHSMFMEQYLNYIVWVRSALLYTAHIIVTALGYDAFIQAPYELQLPDGTSVIIGFSCLGLAMMSFWAAFLMAQDDNWKSKLYWIGLGILTIWFINSWRIALVLVSMERGWETKAPLDHHDLFNLTGYSVILLLMHLYLRHMKRNKQIAG